MKVLITLRVGDSQPGWQVAGSEQRPCPRCGAKVWVSPSALPLLAAGCLLTCSRCVTADEREAIVRGRMIVPRGQRAEIAAFFAGMN